MPREEIKKRSHRPHLPLEAADLLTYIIIGFLLFLLLLQSGQTGREVERAYEKCNNYYQDRMPEYGPIFNMTMNLTIGGPTT